MPGQERSLKEIFLDALAMPSSDRPGWLDAACSGDAELRRRVELMLAAHDEPQSLIDQLAPADAPLNAATGACATRDDVHVELEKLGNCIGPYKLLQKLGEGGMGAVYMAEQEEPVRRKVALKIIKDGLDTSHVIARFEAERQALAMMDHPNIAKVLDAGTTESGRPYFVMELVKGIPITKFCDQQHLTPRERLELFVPVCQAIQHAHQKGIIHRDIKPSNVLIALYDGKPVVKVIDFGVAKATAQKLTERTMFTEVGQIVGTLEYMAPEQAELNNLDIDTRADIYSLGVLLYELLTGSTPFTAKELRSVAFTEMLRLIRESEPPKPSTKLSSSEELPSIAANRKLEPAKLTRLVRGELDWIVMKALEKDRGRRYETANGFAMDVQRYLADEPVQACPPSAWYRFRKYARRNKGALTTAALLAGALITTIVGLAISNLLVINERNQKALALDDREIALRNERAAKKDLQFSLYTHTLARAQREREAGNVGLAEQLLDNLQFDELRGWEWHYLKRLRYGSRRPLPHTSGMWGLAMSPNGRFLAAGDRNGSVRLWDTQIWDEIRTFQAHGDTVSRAAFDSSGRRLATASWDGTVRVWELATGARVLTLEYGSGSVGSVVFGPHDLWIAAGGHDSVKIWEATTGRLLRTLPGHMDAEYGLSLSPDGRCLAVGNNRDRTVELWDTTVWTKLRTLGPHAGQVIELAFRPDGAQLAAACGPLGWTGGPGEVKVWNVGTGQAVHTLRGHIGGAFAVAFTPDGQRLASGGAEDGVIKLWDVQTGRETLTLRGHSDAVWGVGFSPDGRQLYSASLDYSVRAWDATPLDQGAQAELRALRGHAGPVTCVAFSPDNRRLVSGSTDRTVKVWDTQTDKEVRTLTGHAGPVRGLAFSPDGRQLVSVSHAPEESPDATGEVKLWDTRTWQELHSPGLTCEVDYPLGVAFRSDGRRLAVPTGDRVVVWEMATPTPIRTLKAIHSFWQTGVAFGPGDRLASCAVAGTIQVWDLSVPEEVGPIAALVSPPPGLGCLLGIWQATTSLPAHVIHAHKGRAMAVVFSPDGAYLASAGLDGVIKLWDATPLHSVAALHDHLGGVYSLAWAPAGKRLASAGSDAVVRIRDVGTRRPVLTLRGHTNAIYALAFSPNGKLLASGGWDETVMIWDAQGASEQRSNPSAESVDKRDARTKTASESPRTPRKSKEDR